MSEWQIPAVEFLGLRLSLLDEPAVLAAVDEATALRRPLLHTVLNASKVVAAARDIEYRDLLKRFDNPVSIPYVVMPLTGPFHQVT